MTDHCYCSDNIRLFHDNGVFRWERYHDNTWSWVFMPTLFFAPEKEEDTPVFSVELDDDSGNVRIVEVDMRENKNYAYPDVMDRLTAFISEHCPWMNDRMVSNEIIDGYVREVFGKDCTGDVMPLVRAHLATVPFLDELGNVPAAFHDGYYRDNNVQDARDVTASADLRSGIYLATGTYSRPLAALISKKLVDSFEVSEKLSMLKLTRGLPPEKIIDLILDGFLDTIPHSIVLRGLPFDGDDVMVPEWLRTAEAHRHMAWLRDMDVLSDCIQMAHDYQIDMDQVDLRTTDIYRVHNELMDIANHMDAMESYIGDMDDIHQVTPYTDTRLEFSEGDLTVQSLMNGAEMMRVGASMSVCVGTVDYRRRLVNGQSMFFICVKEGVDHPVGVAEVMVSNKQIVEMRGTRNNDLPLRVRNMMEDAIGVLMGAGVPV